MRRDAASVSLLPLCRSVSSSPRTLSSSTPRRSSTVVFPPLLSARACATSSLVVLLCAGKTQTFVGERIFLNLAFSACYGVLRFVMESGAKGCEVVVSGKLRAARAKSMKFTDGFMIHSGQPAVDFVDYAVRHVMLRQGVLGIKVKMSVPVILCHCSQRLTPSSA